jgi:hypothetical protein
MGTVYRSGIDRLVLGSTAERTLYKLNCDVLALKPAGFFSNLSDGLKGKLAAGTVYTQEACMGEHA